MVGKCRWCKKAPRPGTILLRHKILWWQIDLCEECTAMAQMSLQWLGERVVAGGRR
jgi:hypothetical protein